MLIFSKQTTALGKSIRGFKKCTLFLLGERWARPFLEIGYLGTIMRR